ncbi:MAG TPA: hypothetical protein VF132_05640 [Rudaea sp.]
MKDIDESRPLALAGSLHGPTIWMIALLCIPSIIATSVAVVVAVQSPPDSQRVLLFASFVAPVMGVLALVFVLGLIRRIEVRLGRDELIVNTGLRRKVFALADLRAHGLRVVDLTVDKTVAPFLRIMGTSLPGLRSGSFILRNRERGTCVLLDRSRVSYLRSDKDNVSLLLSLERPDELRTALERDRY